MVKLRGATGVSGVTCDTFLSRKVFCLGGVIFVSACIRPPLVACPGVIFLHTTDRGLGLLALALFGFPLSTSSRLGNGFLLSPKPGRNTHLKGGSLSSVPLTWFAPQGLAGRYIPAYIFAHPLLTISQGTFSSLQDPDDGMWVATYLSRIFSLMTDTSLVLAIYSESRSFHLIHFVHVDAACKNRVYFLFGNHGLLSSTLKTRELLGIYSISTLQAFPLGYLILACK